MFTSTLLLALFQNGNGKCNVTVLMCVGSFTCCIRSKVSQNYLVDASSRLLCTG